MVKLGDFEFDPVKPNDFRLSIEGASGSGKSNTLAVILEDLKDRNMPTLLIERLGILNSIRKVDDNFIVVGGRDEEGIDLAIPLEQLDVVADMVLDEGMKIILDINTYKDKMSEEMLQHKAVANVLGELNRKATERLRTGQRRKCLVIIDEVHKLAPERGAQHMDNIDVHVKRSRSEIIDISTEGGNKGINIITAYQRRAYTTKAVVSQSDNYIIHRLHATDRESASKEISVDKEEIANLGTGEALIYGDITNQRVIGPTKIRKRTSPDPREGEFELPTPPDEVTDVIEKVQSKVETKREEQKKRKDELEKLKEKNEKLENENEKLTEELTASNRIEDALQKIAQGGGKVDEDIKKELKELQNRNQELTKEVNNKDNKLGELQEKLEEKEDIVSEKEDKMNNLEAELSELEEIELLKENVVSDARSILRNLGALNPDEEEARQKIEGLEEQLEEKDKRITELKQKKDTALDDELEEAIDFVKNETVRKEIKKAAEKSQCKDERTWDIISILVERGEAQQKDIVPLMDVGRSSVSNILSRLQEHNVVSKSKKGKKTYYSLNTDGMKEIVKTQKNREEIRKLRENLQNKE